MMPRSFFGVQEQLETLGYEPGTLPDVRRAFARAQGIYGTSLRSIPAEVALFDDRWRDVVDFRAYKFRTWGGFRKWKSYIRGALKRASKQASVPSQPREAAAWQAIQSYIETRSGPNAIFAQNRHLSIGVLAKLASAAMRTPSQLDAQWLEQQQEALRYGRRKSFRTGIRFLNELIESRDQHCAISDHLPDNPLPMPHCGRGKPFGGAALPESFLKDLAKFVDWYKARHQNAALATRGQLAASRTNSVNAHRSAVSWLVREVVEDGYIEADRITSLKAICHHDAIRHAAERFAARRRDVASRLKPESESLHSYVAKLSFVARNWVKVSTAERKRLKDLCADRGVNTEQVGKMSFDRERLLIELLADKEKQRAVLRMPETLMSKADALLRDWEDLRPGERMKCLRLGVAAAQTAILLRSIPLRSSNLRHLTFRGENPTLLMPVRADRPKCISIPGGRVKNRRALDAPIAPTAVPIVDRFRSVYREMQITSHPYGKNSVDSEFLFPGTTHAAPLDASAFAQCFEVGVAEIGLAMTQHECRHIMASLILSRFPDRLQMVADWLGDDPVTVRKFYAHLDTWLASERSQAHIEGMARDAQLNGQTLRRKKRK